MAAGSLKPIVDVRRVWGPLALCLAVALSSGCIEDTVIDASGVDAFDEQEDADVSVSQDTSRDDTRVEPDTSGPECSSVDPCAEGEVCEAGSCVPEPQDIFRFLQPLDGERMAPTVTFEVETNLAEVHRVEYLADDWPLGETTDRGSNWSLTYEFNYPGENRIIDAKGFDASGAQVASAQIAITVTNESGRLPGECSAGSGDGNDAQCVLDHHHEDTIVLYPQQVSGVQDDADALDNIKDAAAGRRVNTSCYGNAPCTTIDLDLMMIASIVTMIEDHGYGFRVTSIAGGSHSANSYHYVGQAFDVDKVKGIKINGDSQIARDFMALCSDLGATNVLGPSNHVGHQTHIHCRW